MCLCIVSDRWGRRPAILLSGIIFTVGAIVMGCAPNKETLLAGRIIIGIAVGMFLHMCNEWVTKCNVINNDKYNFMKLSCHAYRGRQFCIVVTVMKAFFLRKNHYNCDIK